MSRAYLTAVAAALVAMCGVVASAAWAAPPDIVREPISFGPFQDEFLTGVCGVPVTTTFEGSVTIRTFEREGTGVLEVLTVNVTGTSTSGDNTVRIKNVGADVTRRTSDGTITLLVAGQAPFRFKGSQLEDAITEAVLRAARRQFTTDRACATLRRA
jgi:hypothetical protein